MCGIRYHAGRSGIWLTHQARQHRTRVLAAASSAAGNAATDLAGADDTAT